MNNSHIRLRWICRRDFPQVVQMQQIAYPLERWSGDELGQYLSDHFCFGVVAESSRNEHFGPIAGYMLYERRNHEIKILSFAVDPSISERDFRLALSNSMSQGDLFDPTSHAEQQVGYANSTHMESVLLAR